MFGFMFVSLVMFGDSVIEIKHLERTPGGWEVAETVHFTIYHNQEKQLVEKVARVAEATRVKVNRKWFASDGQVWEQKCQLVLYATGASYAHATGVSIASPGQTAVTRDFNERIVNRRMDFRCDAPGLLEVVLPHETTHAVLAGQFGRHLVPRWADEGMAVLSESQKNVDLHRRNLAECAKDGELFDLKELMEMKDYPRPGRMKVFYAQSVCLTDFLVREKSPVVFSQFVRDGLSKGYEFSLKSHYSCTFAQLEQCWQKFLLREKLVDGSPK